MNVMCNGSRLPGQIARHSILWVVFANCVLQASLEVLAQATAANLARIDQQIFDCKTKIQELQRREEQMVDELRRGLFCSKCKRSKSEIERTGVTFEKHLQDVKGQAIADPRL